MKEIIQCVLPAILYVFYNFNFAWKGIYIHLILKQIHIITQFFLLGDNMYTISKKKETKTYILTRGPSGAPLGTH